MKFRNLGVALAVSLGATGAGADTLQLFTLGASGTINGALFQEGHAQPAGTGFIDPFIRIQAANGNQKYEAGFNTDLAGRPLDDKDSGGTNFNHSIQIKDMATVTIGGIDYFQFALDFNEPIAGQKSFISMQDFQVFLSSAPDNATYPALGTKIFDMDGSALQGNSRVDGQADLAPGSGKFNMIASVPKALFTGSTSQYIYLYTYFGEQGSGNDKGYRVNGGFEEWTNNQADSSTPVGAPGVPLPAAATGGLFLLTGLASMRRRRDFRKIA